MNDQLTTNAEALRMFFTEEVYLVKGEGISVEIQAVQESAVEQVNVREIIKGDEEPADVTVKTEVLKAEIRFSYLGKNQRQILILVNDAENPVSTEQGRELLRKLVKAIELTANDFALVNYARHSSADFKALSSYFSSKVMFVFGVSPAQLGLGDFPQNSLVDHESTRLIFSSDLHTLDGDPQAKKALWGSLKLLTF